MLSCKIECIASILDEVEIELHDDELLTRLATSSKGELVKLLMRKLGISEDVAESIAEKFESCVQERCVQSVDVASVFSEPVRDLCITVAGSLDNCSILFEHELPRRRELARYIIESILKYYIKSDFELEVDFRCSKLESVVTKEGLVIKCDSKPIIKINHSGTEITLLPRS